MNLPTAMSKPPLLSVARAVLIALLAASLASACHRDAVATPAAKAAAATTATPAEEPPPASAPVAGTKSKPAPGPPPAAPSPDGLVVLAAGQSAEIAPSTTLRFDRIVNDSRCPADAQCIWAGEVRIALTLTTPAGATAFELASERDKTAVVQTLAVELVSFAACPAGECASLRIGPGLM